MVSDREWFEGLEKEKIAALDFVPEEAFRQYGYQNMNYLLIVSNTVTSVMG